MRKDVIVKAGFRRARVPLGYAYYERDGAEPRIAPDPERAPTIRRLFRRVAAGRWNLLRAYLWLKYETCLTTRGGECLSIQDVRHLLTDMTYCGMGAVGCAPIVDETTFRTASALATVKPSCTFDPNLVSSWNVYANP